MSERERVLCPYCGARMRLVVAPKNINMEEEDDDIPDVAWYVCDLCAAQSPIVIRPTEEEVKEAARAAALKRYMPLQKPLTIDYLRGMPLYAWVWIELLDPDAFKTWGKMAKSAYYGKLRDDPNKHEFWCGFPALACAFDYNCYGKSWIAFQHEPTEDEKEAAKL